MEHSLSAYPLSVFYKVGIYFAVISPQKGGIMGKILIGFYIVITLLLAGFAKADQIGLDANVQEVAFEKSTMNFVVSGTSSDACASHVMTVDQKGENGELIEFRIFSTIALEKICIQKITPFVKEIPTLDLIYLSNLKINPDQVYTLKVANSPAHVQVLGSEILGK